MVDCYFKINFYILFARVDFELTAFFMLLKASISMKKTRKLLVKKTTSSKFGGAGPLLYMESARYSPCNHLRHLYETLSDIFFTPLLSLLWQKNARKQEGKSNLNR